MRFLLLEFDAKIKNPFRKRPMPPHEHTMTPVGLRHVNGYNVPLSLFSSGNGRVEGDYTQVLMSCACGHRDVRIMMGHWSSVEMIGDHPLPDGDKIIAALMDKKQ